ncbi:MAG: response regulator, partial [Campylobacterales bacterium]|nr:response regulator [Campylobacterales bacterium]
LDKSVDILIVCAKLFDEDGCKEALEKFKNLQLIYIEGGDDKFQCHHERFHLISQPMTGSSLFNTLIKFIENSSEVTKKIVKSKTSLYNGNILVAEDNITNQMLIEVMLSDRGLDFKIVNNGQEAVDEAFLNHYDIIFMDINMPILDGVSATKELRKRGYDKTIISLSANVIDSDVKSYKEAGVDDSLAKPIIPKELDDILARYLKLNESSVEVNLKFDSVDVEKLSKALSIDNKMIIMKLLQSFAKSSNTILEKLESIDLDADILHNIKGISGNLRFENLYKMSQEFESQVSEWKDDEHKKNKEMIVQHLNHLIKSINSLNKE